VATWNTATFEWDDAKAASNEKKHGVTFVEASTVFEDVDYLVNVDPGDPLRFIAVGLSSVAVCSSSSTPRERSASRIISARRATLQENVSMPNVKATT